MRHPHHIPCIIILFFSVLCSHLSYATQHDITWSSHDAVAMLHRYCDDPVSGEACDTTYLLPLLGRPIDILVIPHNEDEDEATTTAFLATRNDTIPLAVVFMGTPRNGISYEAVILEKISKYQPAIVFLNAKNTLVAGKLCFQTTGTYRNGKIRGIVPVLEVAGEANIITATTNDTMVIDPTSAKFMDSNEWENMYFSPAMTVNHVIWVLLHGGSTGVAVWCIVMSYRRKRNMNIWPISLNTTVALSLWTILIGGILLTVFTIIDPMSYNFRISSSLASALGIVGIPWALVSFVMVICAWIYSVRRITNIPGNRLRLYYKIGLSIAGLVIIAVFVSAIVDILYLYSLRITGLSYPLLYCIAQSGFAVVVLVFGIRLNARQKKVQEESGMNMAKATVRALRVKRKRNVIKGAVVLIASMAVLFSFAVMLIPGVSGHPKSFIAGATLIAVALSCLRLSLLGMFEYFGTDGSSNTSTGTGGTTGVPPTRTSNQSAVSTDSSSFHERAPSIRKGTLSSTTSTQEAIVTIVPSDESF